MRIMKLFNFKRLIIGFLFLAQGCITPMNMGFDTAVPLRPNELSIAGAYSVSDESTRFNNSRFTADNKMLRMGFGVDGKTSVYFGLHHKRGRNFRATERFGGLDELFNTYNFYDFGAKFSSKKQRNVAYKVMLGMYFLDENGFALSLYNSVICTKEVNRQIEVSVILHNTTLASSTIDLYPGMNLNAGFSPDRSRFVIRPEIGISTEAVSAGLGVEFKFGGKSDG